jgi:hypothetical protein
MSTRAELIAATRARYQAGTRAEKQQILDEFVAVSGYHRKYAIHLLGRSEALPGSGQKRSRAIYTKADREALIVVWEAADRICGKRLKAALPVLVPAMERAGHLDVDGDVRERLLAMSAATIDRLLTDVRAHAGRGRRRRQAPAAAKEIGLRTHAGWEKVSQPGWLEVDMVAHSGPSADGRFIQTLVATDIVTGWTEYVPLPERETHHAIEAMRAIMKKLPFSVSGIDTDNDTTFINETMVSFCRAQGVEFTRSRAYRKNDQAWVEQKNGAIIRRLVGHDRYEGEDAVSALMRLYALARLYENYFQPSFKLASKQRDGAHVSKCYHTPASPYQRLRAYALSEQSAVQLDRTFAELDPVDLLYRIRRAQEDLAQEAGRSSEGKGTKNDLQSFVRTLSVQWAEGEARATHRQQHRPGRRTVPDPFEEVWPTILEWLAEDPYLRARQVMSRLQATHPGQYEEAQMRTLQRRLKAWRKERIEAVEPPQADAA